MLKLARTIGGLFGDGFRFGVLLLRPASVIRAENVVLRRQLAKYIERGIKPGERIGRRVSALRCSPGCSIGERQ
ncbi:MAG: hypothetical protein IPH26_09090 [Sterolibacteriaceae bacterium]|uniref:Uncharacterized protein n=1 Tax=Candidatus Methylophosphatis roskildensis TaxID=2899263 RepID=A0A9D7DYC9_9PROT|nr:hypothetical protein [Candidatus Methylophosphatis roskildensis]MBK7237499.1 hypothetical protein [Sterolibacteriaceae bacterium]